MIGGVTRLGGLPGLPGRVTLSAGVTICHVDVSRWGNPNSWSRVHGKKLKSETCVWKLCTFPSRLMAEITRNRNGHTRCVKCSHFGIFNAVNWPYFKLFLITYHVNGSSRNLTPRNTTRDAFINKYIRFRELSFRLSRDVSLGQAQQQPQETSTQHPGIVRLYVNAFYFATTAGYLTHLHVNRPFVDFAKF